MLLETVASVQATPECGRRSQHSADRRPRRGPGGESDPELESDQPDALESFAAFVQMHRSWMLAVARRYIRDRALAEDCVQDAFLSAYRNLHRFEGRSSMRSWLHRIVVNAALMTIRSRRRHDDRDVEDLLSPHEGQGCCATPVWAPTSPLNSAQIIEKQQLAALVRAKISELPDTHRTILRLRDIEELTNAETAERLQISQGAAKVRLHRARAALKLLLEPMLDQLT